LRNPPPLGRVIRDAPIVWGAITGVVQLLVLLLLRKQARRVEEGHMASAIMVASFSVAIGLLNAVSISS
jgi:putative membrane protein